MENAKAKGDKKLDNQSVNKAKLNNWGEMSSNDVHLARVSKIQRSSDNSGSRRCIAGAQQQEARHVDDVDDYRFGSASPRGGAPVCDVGSPDHHTQRDTNESDNNISSCSTLDIVNKVENLSVHQLEMQVRELSQRLQQAEQQRTKLERELEESNAEKEMCFRRLDVISAAHECRITEMHCVIAELSKKLRAKQESTILEELEPEVEGSEVSFQEGSIYNSELNLTNPDVECQTDPLDAAECSVNGDAYRQGHEIENYFNAEDTDELKIVDAVNKGQVEALQEEVLHLKAQIALLQSEIANSARTGKDCDAVADCVDVFEHDADDANESSCSLEQLRYSHREDIELNDLNATRQSDFMASPQKAPPSIPKMAERVKLRCASKAVTTTDLINTEQLKNANIVEHLVSDLKQNRSMLESLVEPSQLDNELQRLMRTVDHLKAHNTVLTLTLDECKEHCEHLYLLCGKYESNAIALQMAVNCSDRAIEAYDVMLALLESKLVLIRDNSPAAEESRKAVESVARHLLDRLESEKNVCENSLGPWQNTFNIPDKVCAPWTLVDDNRLRYHVSKLKGRRATVQNTIVNLESPFSDCYEKVRMTFEHDKEARIHERAAAIDLEMAVLMQELLNLREENIDLKTKVEDTDRERQFAKDRVAILQETVKQLQLILQWNNYTCALFPSDKQHVPENRISSSEVEHAALTEQQLVEALTRESELKERIQTLLASVSATQKISDEKHEKLHNNVRELQKSNTSLSQQVEQNKRKYLSRMRRLEQRIMEMTMELSRQSSISAPDQTQLKCRGASMNGELASHHENVPETTL